MIEQLQDEIEETLANVEDRIIRNRINWLFEEDGLGFYHRLLSLIERMESFQPTSSEIADNNKQTLKQFLIEELKAHESEALQPERESGSPSDTGK